jgi:hypothetical protein
MTAVIFEVSVFCQLHAKFVLYSSNTVNSFVNEITAYHRFGFHHDRSTTDHIFCTNQIQQRKWEYDGSAQQSFIELKKVPISDSME